MAAMPSPPPASSNEPFRIAAALDAGLVPDVEHLGGQRLPIDLIGHP